MVLTGFQNDPQSASKRAPPVSLPICFTLVMVTLPNANDESFPQAYRQILVGYAMSVYTCAYR
jgi:hypothetical protein